MSDTALIELMIIGDSHLPLFFDFEFQRGKQVECLIWFQSIIGKFEMGADSFTDTRVTVAERVFHNIGTHPYTYFHYFCACTVTVRGWTSYHIMDHGRMLDFNGKVYEYKEEEVVTDFDLLRVDPTRYAYYDSDMHQIKCSLPCYQLCFGPYNELLVERCAAATFGLEKYLPVIAADNVYPYILPCYGRKRSVYVYRHPPSLCQDLDPRICVSSPNIQKILAYSSPFPFPPHKREYNVNAQGQPSACICAKREDTYYGRCNDLESLYNNWLVPINCVLPSKTIIITPLFKDEEKCMILTHKSLFECLSGDKRLDGYPNDGHLYQVHEPLITLV